jgi:hypothetical protein
MLLYTIQHTGEASVDKKPARVNAFANGPRRGTGNRHHNPAGPAPDISNPYQPPYGTHPALHHTMPWVMPPMIHYPHMGMYPNVPLLPPGGPYSDPAGYLKAPQAAAPMSRMPLNIPTVKQWLEYCNNHPARSGSVQLSNLSEALERKGFLCIDNLKAPVSMWRR